MKQAPHNNNQKNPFQRKRTLQKKKIIVQKIKRIRNQDGLYPTSAKTKCISCIKFFLILK
jgi:hypothetical protein